MALYNDLVDFVTKLKRDNICNLSYKSIVRGLGPFESDILNLSDKHYRCKTVGDCHKDLYGNLSLICDEEDLYLEIPDPVLAFGTFDT